MNKGIILISIYLFIHLFVYLFYLSKYPSISASTMRERLSLYKVYVNTSRYKWVLVCVGDSASTRVICSIPSFLHAFIHSSILFIYLFI